MDVCVCYHLYSELLTPYQWDVQAPFVIEPSQGLLQPYSSQIVTVFFKPMVSLNISISIIDVDIV